jgi:hypothetical protein
MSPTERTDLLDLYRSVDAEIAGENPKCDVSGRCCRFTEYGHTLFLSAIEAELLFEREPEAKSGAECPYQINGLCTARERRPLGCRTYFCDPNFAARMPEIAEAAVGRLKALHNFWGRAWDYRPLERILPDFESRLGPPSAGKNDLSILSNAAAKLDSSRCGE